MGLKLANAQQRVLVVDDDPIVVDSMADYLRAEGYEAATACDGNEALSILRDHMGSPETAFHLVISDVNMPRVDGLELLKKIHRRYPTLVTLMVTGYGTIESAVRAVKFGAFDYLTKPIIDEEMGVAVEKALRQQSLLSENASLRSRLDGLSGMDTKTVHEQSARKDGPFVTFACGSIPETLLESELFGHVKGAFTGADSDKKGKLRAAEGGTLFIDEINSATPALQLKLLRVLQEKQFEPVGSHETVKADVRFVIATNQNLEELVKAGAFREDLYYRINVVKIDPPALRERTVDVPMLAEHFLNKYCDETGKVVTGIESGALKLLMSYRWPGNVRELENAIERAVVLARRPQVTAEDLPEPIQFQKPNGEPGFVERRRNPWGIAPDWQPHPLRDAIQEPEKQIILAALRYHDWNRQETAKALDINRTTLYKKIKQYGLEELGQN
ncbi:MAG: sigma-54-dependent transcriptional regulator [Planctomycetota bacterium]|jgi:DNA-binding NtrC family response regulator